MATAQPPAPALTEEQLLTIASNPVVKDIVVGAIRALAHTIQTLNGDPLMNALMELQASAAARATLEFSVGILTDAADIYERLGEMKTS